ncbi:MAG: hypothetical protein SGPRY_005447, partial [Prymnesium sp.]
ILYAIGGYDGVHRLSSAERFDPSVGRWLPLPSLSKQRNAAGGAVVKGRIYVAGGTGEQEFEPLRGVDGLGERVVEDWSVPDVSGDPASGEAVGEEPTWSSVERYDPSLNLWSAVAPMRKERAFFGMATLDGKLYVAGGISSEEYLSSAEVYDPSSNSWAPIAPLQAARAFHGMAAFRGKLYVSCGKDKYSNLLKSVESYDPLTGVWKEEQPNLQVRRALQLVAC